MVVTSEQKSLILFMECNLAMIMNEKVEYFLNAIHYCLWLYNIKFHEFIEKRLNALFSPILQHLFTESFKKKNNKCLAKQQEELNIFYYDKKTGYHIGQANYLYGYFYSGYPTFISFLLGGLVLKEFGYMNEIMKLAVLVIPIGLGYIPAYRAVFTDNHYLKYFERFEKEDEQWHKKWKLITSIFCIGSILATVLGICAAFAIMFA